MPLPWVKYTEVSVGRRYSGRTTGNHIGTFPSR